jgi:hypothetical protein
LRFEAKGSERVGNKKSVCIHPYFIAGNAEAEAEKKDVSLFFFAA